MKILNKRERISFYKKFCNNSINIDEKSEQVYKIFFYREET